MISGTDGVTPSVFASDDKGVFFTDTEYVY